MPKSAAEQIKELPVPYSDSADDLSTTEAAEQLKVSERTIRNWIDAKVIHAYKLGPGKSVYRIPQTEVQRILTERTNQRDQPTGERRNGMYPISGRRRPADSP